MTVQTVKILSELVNTPVDKLLTQMKDAGLTQTSASQEVSEVEKQTLLNFLKRQHGEEGDGSQRITLQRKTTTTLSRGDGGKAVNVAVKKKRTYVKRDDVDEETQKQEELLAKRLEEELATAEEARLEAERKLEQDKAAKAQAEAEEKARQEAEVNTEVVDDGVVKDKEQNVYGTAAEEPAESPQAAKNNKKKV